MRNIVVGFLESFRASNRVVLALNSGEKPIYSDLLILGVREERILSDFS